MSAQPEFSDKEMDAYFESGGKTAPEAIVEAEKVEVADVPRGTDEPTEPKVESKVEPKEEPKEGEVQVSVEGKQIPLGELIEERRRRQAAEQRADQQAHELTEMIKAVRSQNPAKAGETIPDPETDPLGYLSHMTAQNARETAELNAWRQQQAQEAQRQAQMQQIGTWAQAQEQEFTKASPDYPQAVEFARAERDKELIALGYSDPQQRQQIAMMNAQEIIGNAIQQGKNPAELLYNYAKAKGYQVKGTAVQAKVPDLDDKVKTIARGQAASKGLSGTSGGAPTEINTLQDLMAAADDMSDDEYSKAFDKLAPRMKGKLV